MTCPGCGVEVAEALSCPQCRRLVHAARLEELAAKARAAWRVGRFAEERALWAESLALLPSDTVQYRSIEARVAEIDGDGAAAEKGSGWRQASLGAGPLLLVLLGKGKFLLAGLTKMSTLVTMLASLGVYWSLYGWAFALGLVLSIYIHEMGHVAAIRRYGFKASAPMFIPGFGALIRMRGRNLPPVPDARIGLAGPVYGCAAALAAAAVWVATRAQIWAVIAHFGAVINLLNLIPVWQLDGARGMRSLTRQQRLVTVCVGFTLWLLTSVPMLLLVAAVGVWRLFTRDWETEPDTRGLLLFTGLMVVLAVTAWWTGTAAAVPAR